MQQRRKTMKRFVGSMFIVMVATVLSACATATPQPNGETATLQPSGDMINPGDRIGDFLITTGIGKEVSYPFDYYPSCTVVDKVNSSCKHIVGRNVNVTTGLYDDSVVSSEPTARLNELWSALNFKLSIEGRPVNLEAFGYIDVQHPDFGVMRFWDVVVVADQPGDINVSYSGTVSSDPFKGTTTFKFSEP
jgi:hypothetical protein